MAEQVTESDTAAALRALRPPAPTRIERRVAIAAILGARAQGDARVRAGRLEIQEKLGEGAMGIVYRAFDPELERTVAVKVLRHQAEEQQRRRLRAEARALARLSHPCVVAVYGLESSEGDTFVVMEYVPGGTLRKWLDTHSHARWREVLALFLQAGEGLAAAHDAGVIHQDFKPENVLVGQDGRVRVADFGLAWVEVIEAKEGVPSSRVAGGTPYFMAPEVALGATPSLLSDQYSYCVALRDALRASLDSNPGERQILEQLMRALERGLERDPDRRWPDMRALLQALARQLSPGAAERQRTLLMERVEQLWLSGMLAESLGGSEPLAIGLEPMFPEDLQRLSLDPAADVAGRRSADHEQLRFARRVEVRSVLELDDLFDGADRSLAIIGAPGAGKTTALLSLARSLLRRCQADFEEPVPVVLSLATFDPKRPLADWITAELHTKYGLPSRWARRWLEQRALVLMLDGLDEVSAARQSACVSALNQFLDAEAGAGCVVTCREAVYADLQARPEVGATIRVAQVHEALALAVLRRAESTPLLESWPKDAELRQLLSNPLMLRLAAQAAAAGTDVAGGASLRRRLYAHFVGHLLARTSDAPEQRERIARGLRWLAQAMNRRGTSDVWLERLQADWLPEPENAHLARGLGAICVSLGIVCGSLTVQLAAGLPVMVSIAIAILALIACWSALRTTRIEVAEGVRWSWRRAVRWLPVGLVAAALLGGLLALRYWLASGAETEAADALGGVLTNLGYGALLGLLGVFATGLEPGDQAGRAEPGAGLRESLSTALGVSVPAGVVCGLGLGYVALPLLGSRFQASGMPVESTAIAISAGAVLALVLFFVYGGAAVLFHWALRCVLALRTPLPLRLVRFLDDAVRAGILRSVGGGYMFVHRTLLDYVATLDDEALARMGAPPGGSTRQNFRAARP